jgi:hypothetical protein
VNVPRFAAQTTSADPLGKTLGRVLLVELLALDAVRKALEGHRAVTDVVDQ